MCGIFCSVHHISKDTIESCKYASLAPLNRRGPDSQNDIEIQLQNDITLCMYGAVLHMRGELTTQPICNPNADSYLLWNGEIFSGIEVPGNVNDGQVLLNLLDNAQSDKEITEVFTKVQGPYAFIYYQKSRELLWFGRDVFGRRSLVFCHDSNNGVCFSSVCLKMDSNHSSWKELPANGIFKLDLSEGDISHIYSYPWSHNDTYNLDPFKVSLCESISLKGYHDLNMLIPDDSDVLKGLLATEDPIKLASNLLHHQCEQLLDILMESVRRRVCGESNSTNAPISIMFSGGIDSMMLAYLADKCLPQNQQIDLLNVAFESNASDDFQVPDRLTGLTALSELNQDRQWNFVEINISKSELQRMRSERISQLIQPLDSVLDDSIGCAMWFASRGKGFIKDHEGKRIPYCSKAKVVLSGLGADEQLGGYSRHRSSFLSKGWQGLLEELNLDIRRISSRNLGRDDRIIADHGKEARFPFLDERVVSFCNSLPISHKMLLTLPRGVGEKLLLRACAYRCGLLKSCSFAKRAIQFGSRIAKCEDNKEKGSDLCKRLLINAD